jgi:hypothetical protein
MGRSSSERFGHHTAGSEESHGIETFKRCIGCLWAFFSSWKIMLLTQKLLQ